MTLTPMHFLIVCPLVGLAGFVDSIAGGGGLISLPAYLLTGLPVHACIATNKLSSPMGTLVSTVRYAREGYIDWRLAVFCAAGALAGASVGASIALLISDALFRWLMLIILPLTAAYVLRAKTLAQDAADEAALPFWRSVLAGTLISLLVGMYDGFYGPGAGTFLLLLLSRFGHMNLQRANGVTKVANLSSNVASLAVYLMNGQAAGAVRGVVQHRGQRARLSLLHKARRIHRPAHHPAGAIALLHSHGARVAGRALTTISPAARPCAALFIHSLQSFLLHLTFLKSVL